MRPAVGERRPGCRLLFLLLLALLPASLFSQPRRDIRGGAFQTGLGLFPDQGWRAPVLGGVGYRQLNRIRLGSEGLVWLGTPDHLTGAVGLFEVGYALIDQPGWAMAPQWGFGGGYFRFPDQVKETRFVLTFGFSVQAEHRQSVGEVLTTGLRASLFSSLSGPHATGVFVTLTLGRLHD